MREYTKMVKNTFNYSGRARRREYWIPAFINSGIQLLLFGIVFLGATIAGDGLFYTTGTSAGFSTSGSVVATILYVPYALFSLFSFITMLSLNVRRMHDIGKPGWIYAICLLGCCCCGIGAIANIVLCCFDSMEDNEWGENPKNANEYEGSKSILMVGIVYPLILIFALICGVMNAMVGTKTVVGEKTFKTEERTREIITEDTEEPTEVVTTEDTEEPTTEDTEEPATKDTEESTTESTEEPVEPGTGEEQDLVLAIDDNNKVEILPQAGFEVTYQSEYSICLSKDDELDVSYGASSETLEDVHEVLGWRKEDALKSAEESDYAWRVLEEECVFDGETEISGNKVYYIKVVTDMGSRITYDYEMYVDIGAEYLLEVDVATYGIEITDEEAFQYAQFTK